MNTPDSQPRWYVSVTLALLPLVIIGIVLGARPTPGTGATPAPTAVALVNLDQSGATGGQALVDALVASPTPAFSWTAADQATADADLASGTYGALVTIPNGIAASDVPAGTVVTVQVSPTAAVAAKFVATAFATGVSGVLSSSAMSAVHVVYGAQPADLTGASDGIAQAETEATALTNAASAAADQASQLVTEAATIPSGKPEPVPASVIQAATSLSATAKSLDDALNAYAATLRGLATGVTCPDALAPTQDACDGYKQGFASAADQASRAFVSAPALVQSRTFAQDAAHLATSLKNLSPGANTPTESDFAKTASDLETSVKDLADQATKLASTVSDAKQALPSAAATPSPSDSLADLTQVVITDVVPAPANPASGSLAWITVLMVVALWFGALATFLVVRPVPSGPSGTRVLMTFDALWPGLAIGGAQALLVTAAGHFALGLDANGSIAMAGILLLAAFAFSAVNQALALWLGWGGRVIATLLGVLVGVEAFGSLTGIFGAVRGIWPATGALDGLRGIVGDGDVALGVIKLVCWLIVGVAVVVFGVIRTADRHSKRQSRAATA